MLHVRKYWGIELHAKCSGKHADEGHSYTFRACHFCHFHTRTSAPTPSSHERHRPLAAVQQPNLYGHLLLHGHPPTSSGDVGQSVLAPPSMRTPIFLPAQTLAKCVWALTSWTQVHLDGYLPTWMLAICMGNCCPGCLSICMGICQPRQRPVCIGICQPGCRTTCLGTCRPRC